MNSKSSSLKKLNPNARLGERIERILREKGPLPVCAVKGILEERLDKKINRRRIYRKINRMQRWDRVIKTTEKRTAYFRLKERR